MTPTSAALLCDVAAAIVASGYAVPVPPKREGRPPKCPHVRRAAQIAELAQEKRVECGPTSTARAALLEDVMNRYNVSRGNARRMVRRAKKMREDRQ